MISESGEMKELRDGIDEIDAELVRLLDRRALLTRRVGELKRQNGVEAYAPARERRVLDRVFELSGGEFPRKGLEAVFREIISSSISLEERLKVSYLGPEATFTHEAARLAFGSSVDLEPRRTVAEVFQEVEKGKSQHGVVPVENSMEGAVTHTLDEFMSSPLKICGEIYLPVLHSLLSREGPVEAVERVLSHPMALAQAGGWLQRELPRAKVEEVESTAEAASRAAQEPGVAAVGSELAAEGYGLSVLVSGIQESRTNATRFIVLGRQWSGCTGEDKTSVILDPSGVDRPGMLRDALSSFAEEGINLTRIESRPSRRQAWTYVFFADFQGHPEEERTGRALGRLKTQGFSVSVIGAYPRLSSESAEG